MNDEVRRALTEAPLDVIGRLVSASNATLLCTFDSAVGPTRCVYKPTAGERPLWDFPDGSLGHREVAAALIADAVAVVTSTSALVPPTVWRDVGPFGPGMCQLWVEDAETSDVDVVAPDDVPTGWLVSVGGIDGRHQEVAVVHDDVADLRRLALFDLVVNNADRKGGHILRDPSGRLFGIDHGVTHHVENKLRTVLWGWAGTEITDDEAAALTAIAELVRGDLATELGEHLAPAELTGIRRRIRTLLRHRVFPTPQGEWPAIPWPVF